MNGYQIPKTRVWSLKIISVIFVAMNIYQVIEILPNDLRYVVVALFGVAFYILMLLRLYRIRVEPRQNVSVSVELDSMPSLEC